MSNKLEETGSRRRPCCFRIRDMGGGRWRRGVLGAVKLRSMVWCKRSRGSKSEETQKWVER
jgi:hypothetical protein